MIGRRFDLIRSVLLAGPLASVLGCSGDLYDMTHVEGTITYEDGTPIPADSITLRFTPLTPSLDPKRPPKPAITQEVDPTGKFSGLTTYRYHDGLIRGRHKVAVTATRGGKMGLVPHSYEQEATTTLEIDTSDSPLELRIPKPTRPK
jgi:hypothetical protein